ncbi:MAG: PIN domain-containing protein [Nitrospirae bacterium]|nr:PIN domain-containing protein [Nitrospirota bacterium]
MPINYIIQADVIDVRTDIPQPHDIFLVDSNVWYWMTYTQASTGSIPYQTKDYPVYIKKALSLKSKLHMCGLSLAELAHNIEKTERKIFIRSNGFLNSKEYRHNFSAERTKVTSEIQAAWSQVKTMAKTIGIQIDELVTDAALLRLSAQPLDGYDLFILEAISGAGIVKVITDDGDYVTVPGIQVFTSNQNVIVAAQSQGKLLTR